MSTLPRRPGRPGRCLATTALAVVLLGGCANDDEPPAAAPGTPGSPAPAPTSDPGVPAADEPPAAPGASAGPATDSQISSSVSTPVLNDEGVAGLPTQRPAPGSGPSDEDAEFPDATPSPSADAASREAARRSGLAVMEAFARPKLGADRWWRELSPLLTDSARVAYFGTDPAEVPASEVTGRARLRESGSGYLARVQIPTDAGRYEVLLVRTGPDGAWLAERITPPETAPLTRTTAPDPKDRNAKNDEGEEDGPGGDRR